MLTRTLFRLTLLAGLTLPLCAFALGLGPLAVRSALNQNFEAEIPLTVSNPNELTGLTVRIPRQQDFDQVGIERLALLSKLRFSIQTPSGGPNLIKISSVEPIRDPNFNLMLELVWSRGRLIRVFPVQVDPELYANRRPPPPPLLTAAAPPPVVATPPVAAAPPAALALPPAPAVSFDGASTYGPIRPGETLMAVARKMRPSTTVSLPQMMSILLAGNPDAFANGNPNTLRKGAVLKMPTAQALGVPGAPPASPETTVAAVTAPSPTALSEGAAPPSTPASEESGSAASPPKPATAPAVTEPATAAPSASGPATPAPSASGPIAPAPTITGPVAAPPPAPGPVAAPPPAPGSVAAPTAVPPPPLESGAGAPVVPPVTSTPSVPSPGAMGTQPQEIVPQASIPQTEASPAPASVPPSSASVTPSPTTATTPTVAAEPKPVVAPPVSPPKPPTQPVVETGLSWMDNPLVWFAIALILLAIASLVLLPLLRRRAHSKPDANAFEAAIVASSLDPATSPPKALAESPRDISATRNVGISATRNVGTSATRNVDTPATRSVVRAPDLTRPIILAKAPAPAVDAVSTPAPAVATPVVTPAAAASIVAASIVAAPVAAAPVAAKPPVPAPQPKSVTELLREIDFGPEGVSSAFDGRSNPPALNLRLPDTEPVTTPATTPSTGSLIEPLAQAESKPASAQSRSPAELRLEGFDFDFSELGLQRPPAASAELPPLDMKPLHPTAGVSGFPLEIDRQEPPTEPTSGSSISAILAGQAAAHADAPAASKPEFSAPAQQFTFTDITQDIGKHGTGDAQLDEELQNFGDQTLNLELESASKPLLGNGSSVEARADYVETKLDLATAYLDMGDQVGARSLLAEVLQEGNAAQKQRADELLKKVG